MKNQSTGSENESSMPGQFRAMDTGICPGLIQQALKETMT